MTSLNREAVQRIGGGIIRGMGGRSLTHQQRLFAELLASGCTKVEAFRRAYPSNQRSKTTEWQGGKRVAGLPQVQDEVKRLTLLRSPHDVAAQSEHIAARLLELTKDSDPEVALRAIAQWSKLAEAGLLKPPIVAGHAAPTIDRAQVISKLRSLYHKALGPPQTGTQLLDPQPSAAKDADGFVIEGAHEPTTITGPALLSTQDELPPALQAAQNDGDDQAQTEVPAKRSRWPGEYEWQYLPGSFGKARRARVRIT